MIFFFRRCCFLGFILCKFLCTISRPVHRHKYTYGACPSAGHVASTAAETSFPQSPLVTVEFMKHIRSPKSQKTNIFQRHSGFPRVAHPIPVLSSIGLLQVFFLQVTSRAKYSVCIFFLSSGFFLPFAVWCISMRVPLS